ncbi:hypothetical protein L5515_016788 [Caenorhabditis briggsae]|uniref:Uncharacterized protein n=1 Tax=Caenorhabditis briggsae TaxID=6238 RepID=A0AAE9JRS9_CAEBR|nr:hypothetical protein L5515_016788 [Caenorhabditis briggsae]
MAELDQQVPTTSSFRPAIERAVVKMKRIHRFTRQFSIFIHTDEENKRTPVPPKEEETNEDSLFKYPGDLRAVKRKRNLPTQSNKTSSVGAKRKMMAHQKSIREGEDAEGSSEISKADNKEAGKEQEPEEDDEK